MEYIIKDKIRAFANKRMNNDSVKKLWSRFCLGQSDIEIIPCDEFVFRIGDIPLPELREGKEYVISVTESGAAVVGKDYASLMHGFFSLIMKIEFPDKTALIRTAFEESGYRIKKRMIHICVFPENDLYFIKKLIRLSALCQYTHIVIEFWGMLKYDCLRELSWENAFTKEEATDLIRECRELGIEPIPMFNQLGHATASRLCYGKHVVLDQNPTLQYLFTPDGWAWNIESEETWELLRKVRAELYELFGEGEYMHIGCDEAYYYTRDNEKRKKLPEFLSRLTGEVAKEGRRPMLWMDMLLERERFKNEGWRAYATAESDEVEALQNSLHPSSVMVDWQYNVTKAPVSTLVSLKDVPYDVVGAPWYNPDNYTAITETLVENDMHGVMLTTWHTLKDHMPSILDCAKKCGASTFIWSESSGKREETATLLRRISFEGNSYADSGWSKAQIEI